MAEKLGTMIVVGATRFHAGVKVGTAQGAIDSLWRRSQAMYALLDRVKNHAHRLPPALESDIVHFFKGDGN
jgi:hypothetical protein